MSHHPLFPKKDITKDFCSWAKNIYQAKRLCLLLMIQRVSSVSIYQLQVEDRTWLWWRNSMELLRNHWLSLHIRVQFRTFTLVLKVNLRQDKQNSCPHSWEGGKRWLSLGIPNAILMLWISHDAVMLEQCSYLGNHSRSWIRLNKVRQRW